MSTLKVDTITNLTGAVNTGLALSVPLKILETAEPSNPPATGYGYIWGESDGKLYFKSDNVSKMELSGTGISATSANTFTRGQVINGGQDEVQLQIQSNGAPQGANLFEITTSTVSNKYLTVTNNGNLELNSDSSTFKMGDDAGFVITHDGSTGATIEGAPITIGSTGILKLESSTDIELNADGADILLKDDTTTFGGLTNSSGNLIIKSGTTTAATFDGANVTLAGTVGCGAITGTATIQGTTITATTAFVPDASAGAALGTSSLEFSNLFLADGAVINLGDDQDITLTHVADTGITLTGAHTNGTNLRIDNTAGDGDSLVSFQLSGTTKWSIGCEDGDSDKFIIESGSGALGAAPALEIASDKTVTFMGAYKETIVPVTNSGNTVTFNMASGNIFASMGGNSIGADVTTLVFQGMTAGQSATWIVEKNGARDISFLVVKKTDADGGNESGDIGFFPNGEVPPATDENDKIDMYTFFMNSDDNIYIMVGGLNFGANS
jgi:hypothetical protein